MGVTPPLKQHKTFTPDHHITKARALAARLGGRWHGGYGTAACPACQPERRRDQNALSLRDGDGGRLLLYCHKSGCAFAAVLAAAGVAPARGEAPPRPVLPPRQDDDARRKSDAALRLWDDGRLVEGTPAARYLREARGLHLKPLPPSLRYHPATWHGPSGQHLPAMVALVQGTQSGRPAVHRTFLAPDGAGKAAVEPAKLALGPTAGGAVRLRGGRGVLIVGEGIESTLAAYLLRRDAAASAWAALSAAGMRGLCLPPVMVGDAVGGRLCIAADHDDAGIAAARELAARAHAAGWIVTIATPDRAGADWADVLAETAGKAVTP